MAKQFPVLAKNNETTIAPASFINFRFVVSILISKKGYECK
jgi:hypothetical protein